MKAIKSLMGILQDLAICAFACCVINEGDEVEG